LRAYCAVHAIGVVVGPGAVPHSKSELQPDVQVIPGTPRLTAKWASLPRPLLVVEVLSESTSGRDLGIKRDAYLRWGIREYWAVDIDARCVWVSRTNVATATAVDDTLRWQPDGASPALELRLDELFR
jgi:Uma2 family endonuclease